MSTEAPWWTGIVVALPSWEVFSHVIYSAPGGNREAWQNVVHSAQKMSSLVPRQAQALFQNFPIMLSIISSCMFVLPRILLPSFMRPQAGLAATVQSLKIVRRVSTLTMGNNDKAFTALRYTTEGLVATFPQKERLPFKDGKLV